MASPRALPTAAATPLAGLGSGAASLLGGLSSEGELLQLAQQQAARDGQLAQQQAARDEQTTRLQQELSEARDEVARRQAAEVELRGQLQQLEMREKREGASVEYIKCLVLKLLSLRESEHEALFPALATCLQFTEEEVRRAQYSTRAVLE